RPEGAEGSTRRRLTEEDVEETRHVPDTGCPHCGRNLSHVVIQSQIYETVIPAKRRVVQVFWHDGVCPEHGEVSLRPGDAAPKAHLSNEVILMAAELAVWAGMSLEKVSSHLKKRFGIEVTTGGLAQAFQRLALGLADEVRAIDDKMEESEAVHADETGARVDGESWWMWAFVTRCLASFRVDPSRGSEVIFRVLGEHFLGVLVSDFFSAYNVPDCRKQKCLTHLLRELQEILLTYEDRPGPRPPALLAMKQWAKDALELKDRKSELSEGTYKRYRFELEKRLDQILTLGSGDADVLRLLDRLWKHRDEVLLFLYVDSVEGANNRVERAIDFVKTGLEILQRTYRGLPAGVLVETIRNDGNVQLDENRPP
ncbi:MAG: IS66 family transposase, partial [Planctomycetes bacterium]|nr:IS66 family transposase [Planctomycetota bacterium]